MSSWKIDPSSGDYLMVNGRPVPSDELTIPAYYRITIPRGRWMYAPDAKYGSDLNTLKKKTGNAALGMVNNALQPMVDDGRALAVDAEFDSTVLTNRNGAAIAVKITDALGTPQILALPQIGN